MQVNEAPGTELNGRPAKEFRVVISENQFQITHNGAGIASSSSTSTLCNAFSDMMKLAGKDVEFALKGAESTYMEAHKIHTMLFVAAQSDETDDGDRTGLKKAAEMVWGYIYPSPQTKDEVKA